MADRLAPRMGGGHGEAAMMGKTASYRCLSCSYEWTVGFTPHDRPEDVPLRMRLEPPADCPRCHHKYMKWLNHETDWVR